MADENMECLAEALLKAQPKQQKVLLKVINLSKQLYFLIHTMHLFLEHGFQFDFYMHNFCTQIIKRVVSLNEYHADHVYSGGAETSSLFAALRQVGEDAERHADSALSQLAHDIVACIEGRGSVNR